MNRIAPTVTGCLFASAHLCLGEVAEGRLQGFDAESRAYIRKAESESRGHSKYSEYTTRTMLKFLGPFCHDLRAYEQETSAKKFDDFRYGGMLRMAQILRPEWLPSAWSDHKVRTAADYFNITPDGIDALLDGRARIGIELLDPPPAGAVRAAELRLGGVLKGGDIIYREQHDANGIVTHVDVGEVEHIVKTGTPGIYDIVTKYKQESETTKWVEGLKSGIPVEGEPLPPDWRD